MRCDGALALITPGSMCVRCAEQARLAVLGGKVPRGNPDLRLGGLVPPTFRPLVDALAERVRADPDVYRDTVLAVRTDLGTVTTHSVRVNCGELPADDEQGVRIDARPEPVRPGTLRGDNPLTDGDRLREALVDLRYGPVVGVLRTGDLPLAVASAELVGDHLPRMAGYGRTASFADAERVALYEAVERRNGMRPCRRRTTVVASFAELGPDRALDPARLGRHEPRYERHPDFDLVPYTPDVRTTWVHGWSYTNAKPIAVPEHVAYWSVGGSRFVDETSNGCGLGNSLTEAVLHGLFEVAERDAFLMAWYARTPLRRLAVPARDPVLPHLADRLASRGYELLFFDATNDIGIPSVISLARYHGTDERTPAAFFAAGGHPDPHQAMVSAAAEVAVDVEAAAAEPTVFGKDRLRRMLAEPTLVRTMKDHTAVNSLPEAAPRHAFLIDDAEPTEPIAQQASDRPLYTDLRAMLDDWVRRLAELDLEVIAVDQTDPVIAERLGLYSAKVIVPGTLPMTFGELHRRTLGLPRLLDVPYRLGRVPAPLSYESLALQPHPFP